MRNSKFVRLLATLDGWELNRFQNYIEKGNDSRQALSAGALMKYIKSSAKKSFDSRRLESSRALADPRVACHIKGSTALNKTVHHLYKELEDFIIATQSTKDPIYRQKVLSQRFSENKLYADFAKSNERFKEQIKNSEGNLWEEYHQGMVELSTNIHESDLLAENMLRLDKAYLEDKLRLSCEMASRKVLGMIKNGPSQIDRDIINLIDQLPNLSMHVQIMVDIFETLVGAKPDSNFIQIHSVLEREQPNLSELANSEMITLLNNHYIQMISEGASQYASYYKSMTELQHKQGRLIGTDGEIQSSRFFNIVVIFSNAQGANKYADWLLSFIDDFELKLPKRDRKFYPDFCRAIVHMRLRRDYTAAEEFLQDLKPRNTLYSILYRRELWKVYYSQYASDKTYQGFLKGSLQNFEKLIKRSKGKLAAQHVAAFLKTVACYKTLLKLSNETNEQAAQFRDRIKTESLPDGVWLAEQLEQLHQEAVPAE